MKNSYNWTLEAFEKQGNLFLKWSQDAPFRAQQGKIYVFSGDSFSGPIAAWQWDFRGDSQSFSPWDSGLRWGTGWYCAYVAEAPSNGSYTPLVEIITDSTMGPDIAKEGKLVSKN